jgi:hypothetical protein
LWFKESFLVLIFVKRSLIKRSFLSLSFRMSKCTFFYTHPKRKKWDLTCCCHPNSLLCNSCSVINYPFCRMPCPKKKNNKKNTNNFSHLKNKVQENFFLSF